jgi:hypothetical protein
MEKVHSIPEDEQTCPQCERKFPSEYFLKKHIYQAHTIIVKKGVTCLECFEEFKHVNNIYIKFGLFVSEIHNVHCASEHYINYLKYFHFNL